jgi:hypothetical protein
MNTETVSITLPAPSVVPQVANDKWQREYQAFLRLKPQLLETHGGLFVVIHNGQVVESGPDDVTLALQFFTQYGNTPVHIGLVTQTPEAPIRIPHYRQKLLGDKG